MIIDWSNKEVSHQQSYIDRWTDVFNYLSGFIDVSPWATVTAGNPETWAVMTEGGQEGWNTFTAGNTEIWTVITGG